MLIATDPVELMPAMEVDDTLVKKPASLFRVLVLPLNAVAYGRDKDVVKVADDTENPLGTDDMNETSLVSCEVFPVK